MLPELTKGKARTTRPRYNMIDAYRAELNAPPSPPLAQGAPDQPNVRRVQEWLSLHGNGVLIDGDFGPATERAARTAPPL